MTPLRCLLFVTLTLLLAVPLFADDSPQQRGPKLPVRGVFKDRLTPHWFADGTRFWYRNDLKSGTKEFVLVDAVQGTREPAFDHAKLAKALTKSAEKDYTADRLPFSDIRYTDDGKALQFTITGTTWSCDLTSYECTRTKRDPVPETKKDETADEAEDEIVPASDPFQDPANRIRAQRPKKDEVRESKSPDGTWTAVIKDYNVVLRDKEGKETPLTTDGKEMLRYGLPSWSPDSKALIAWRIEPGEAKQVHLVESSPRAGGRAVVSSRPYPLPGDKFTAYDLHLFNPDTCKETPIKLDKVDFGFPRVRWAKEGHTFTYQKVDRGHQRLRLIEVDAREGTSRTLIDEKSETFIWTQHYEAVAIPAFTWLEKSDELVYCTEKSGWRRLYLMDAKSGREKNPITPDECVVRSIERLDEEKRQIWFRACGLNKDQDPYFIHFYRVNFDGTGLVALTAGNGTHTVQFSPDRKFLIDTYSRVDAAPRHELRSTADGKLVCNLEEADIADLNATGWEAPEVFVAKGRDGTTDIWGIICRPRDFDPSKKYPVIEQIYAGPQGSFVPKPFSGFRRFSNFTDLGFVAVQMDGMGTANRSKAFHDVCWKNLKDAGFPDRILWHKAVAAKYPWYDISRVGVTGGSAGGQNATGGVLFHGDFYKAAVSGCGCHDNRMDKASWNEQWMGYPVGPQYSASSNIDNAKRLSGKLLLIVGELDTNVPPESTYRLCDALIRAGKDFDFVLVPGVGHGMGGAYGSRRQQDFFVRHLQGKEPPDRNSPTQKVEPKPAEPPAPKPAEPEAKKPVESEVKKPAVLDLTGLAKVPASAAIVARQYDADRGSLTRAYPVPFSPARTNRLAKFYTDWIAALKAVDTNPLTAADSEELAKLRARAEGEYQELMTRAAADAATLPWVPFAGTVVGLEESRRRMQPVEPFVVAGRLAGMPKTIATIRSQVESAAKGGSGTPGLEPTNEAATRAADATDRLRATLKSWFGFFDGYDPLFTWWVGQPYKEADRALDGYAKFLRETASKLPAAEITDTPLPRPNLRTTGPSNAPDLAAMLAKPQSEMIPVLQRYGGGRGGRGFGGGGRGGSPERDRDRDPDRWLEALAKLDFELLSRDAKIDYVLFHSHLKRESRRAELRAKEKGLPVVKDESGISGRPIGRAAMLVDFEGEMIPYSPAELIAMARVELDWCEAEMKKASREMGLGDDWKKALEKVKTLHVQPGEQPKLIRELAVEAVDYLNKHQLVTVPPIAAETWRMEMMSPERQLVNPFFTGGEVISVSFPTNTMAHDAKLQSMRGNNPHMSRATVHHELIPGHHLQGFTSARVNTHRSAFGTPFWHEGMAVYWEMVLYDRGFPKTPEDRVGFLVWRMHRCARVIFSLGFHLGEMKPKECVQLLIDRVGFEPDNAAAEVRRSFGGGYGPLYQAAYLVGAMQFRALRRELVDTGKMPEREFHDAILHAGRMPVALIRAALTGEELEAKAAPVWKFDGRPSTRD